MNYNNYFEDYKNSMLSNTTKNTNKSYLPRIEKFLAWLNGEEITKKLVQEYMNELSQSVSGVTQNSYKCAISSFCEYLISNKHMEDNPTFGVKIKKKEKKSVKKVSDEHFELLIKRAQQEKNRLVGLRMEVLIRLYGNSGLRANEALDLNKSDLIDDRLLHIIKAKRDKTRNTFITPEDLEVLKQYAELIRGEKLFPVTYNTVQLKFKEYCEELDLLKYGYTLHKLRHRAITKLYVEKEKPAKVISIAMGVTTKVLEDNYVHVNDDDVYNLLV